MNLDRTIKMVNETEGRDKFCKMIQYLARFLKFQCEGTNEALFEAFNGLFTNMSTARKLFRLFKSFMEYKKIMTFLKNETMEDRKVFEHHLQIGLPLLLGLRQHFSS